MGYTARSHFYCFYRLTLIGYSIRSDTMILTVNAINNSNVLVLKHLISY